MANAELGGINGHPIKLNKCFIAQAEEEGVRCGQQMVNDKVKTILFGFVTVPNQSIYATVKGTNPVIGGITSAAADTTAKNAYFLNGSQTTGSAPSARTRRGSRRTSRPRASSIRTTRARSQPRPLSGRACSRWE